MLFLRATGLPFYLYDTRSTERLHLRRKITEPLHCQTKNGGYRKGYINDLQLLRHFRHKDKERINIQHYRYRQTETETGQFSPFAHGLETHFPTHGAHDLTVDLLYRLVLLCRLLKQRVQFLIRYRFPAQSFSLVFL